MKILLIVVALCFSSFVWTAYAAECEISPGQIPERYKSYNEAFKAVEMTEKCSQRSIDLAVVTLDQQNILMERLKKVPKSEALNEALTLLVDGSKMNYIRYVDLHSQFWDKSVKIRQNLFKE